MTASIAATPPPNPAPAVIARDEAPLERTDVLIVGAGPTGLTLALILQERGISYRLVDKLAAPQPNTRANTVMSRTFEVFGRLGIAERAFARGAFLPETNVHLDGRQVASLGGGGDSDFTPYPYLYNLPQRRVEEVLGERLQELGGQVERGVELVDFVQEAGVVSADLITPVGPERVVARFLVGCDGAGSRVRKGLGIPLVGETYAERFVVGDLSIAITGPRDATLMWLNRDGFFLAWPHPEPDSWHVVFNLTAAQDAAIGEPTAADVGRILAERSGRRGVRVWDPVWLSKFRIHKRSAPRYQVGNVFLAGDAAHLHSPMAGMGMGNSIQDAYNLGWKLADAIAGRLDPALLASYQEERQPVAERLTGAGDFSHRIFVARSSRLRFLRDRVLLPLLGSGLLARRLRRGIGDDYRASSLAVLGRGGPPHKRRRGDAAPEVGDRAPDGPAAWPTAADRGRLYDRFRGIRWSLLLFAGAGGAAATYGRLAEVAAAATASWGDLAIFAIVRGQEPPPALANFPGEILFDPTFALHRRYGAEGGALILVRPDDYLAFVAKPAGAAPLLEFLAALAAPTAKSQPARAGASVAGSDCHGGHDGYRNRTGGNVMNEQPMTVPLAGNPAARRPAWVSDDLFPFPSRFIEIDGNTVHYVDEGEGPIMLMLHGNPTWSFLYRDVIQGLRPAFRCIALDYPGFGLSTAAPGYGFTPEEHSRVVRRFIETLDLRGLTMMFQDWGGPVGLGAAIEMPERMRAVVPLNSRAWPDLTPQQEKMSRQLHRPLGAFLVRRFNLFVRMGVPLIRQRKLSREELLHYRMPLPGPHEAERTLIFGQSIVGAAAFLQRVKEGLPRLSHLPALIIWAQRDTGFTEHDRILFEHFFPNHETVLLPEANHFLQEDAPEEIVRAVRAWWSASVETRKSPTGVAV